MRQFHETYSDLPNIKQLVIEILWDIIFSLCKNDFDSQTIGKSNSTSVGNY